MNMVQSTFSERLNVNKFSRLFKKTNTGAIQYWDIFVQEKTYPNGNKVGEIVTMYGQVGTTSPQRTSDTVLEGKNLGKRNATTAFEQAVKEAKSKWEKQKKEGYVESEEAARAQEVDSDFVAGGLFPMLAQSFSKHAKKIAWPCYVQPKLDGHRCIAIVKNGKATLWSRTRKPITSVPHIIVELEANFTDIILDGELYNHSYHNNFEELASLIRQEVPAPGHENVQYHVYDMVTDKPFADRNDELFSSLSQVDFNVIVPVATQLANDETEVTVLFTQLRAAGYEGVMLRNGAGLYAQNKRSYDLQKMKEFEDAEFQITGIEEGRGKLQGHVGALLCRTKEGHEFKAKMSGSLDNLRKLFEDESLWKNKLLTVQFQGLTGANGVPRFPVGLRIRNEE
jgi:DNA ligase-1